MSALEPPIRNLRVRFWGVQGSCPLFPNSQEVADYKRMVKFDLLKQVLQDVEKRGSGCTAADLLGGTINDDRIMAYLGRMADDGLPVYGGDTTCLTVETADGELILIDGGSGIRNGSKYFAPRWPADRKREIHILGTHEHLDHRSGLPFCQFCYVRPPFDVHVYGGYQFLQALDERYGVFSRQISRSTHLDDPIDYRAMAAVFKGHELRNNERPDFDASHGAPHWDVRNAGEPLVIGKTRVMCHEVYHGSVRCLAYKIQRGSAAFFFCTDHELRHGDPGDPRQQESERIDRQLDEYFRGVDVAYIDGQYFRQEYEGKKGIGTTAAVSRVDWGHGCIEDVIERTRRCGIRKTFIGHHDPERTWVERLDVDRWLQKQCQGQPFSVALAKSDDMIDL
jgi:hypothetical protein